VKAVKKRSQFKAMLFRYKKNKMAMLGAFMLMCLILVAVFANFLADYETGAVQQNMSIRLTPPNKEHIFGTDHYGRDIFARIVYGARISLFVGLLSILSSMFFGCIIGSIAGYFGGVADDIIMRIMDILLSIPSLLLAISIVAALGSGSIFNLLLAMSISQIPRFARIVRSSILTIRNQEYIEAARASGSKNARIILTHVLPNAMGPIIVQATLNIGSTILSIAALSFVGLGISPPTPEWGSMLSDVKNHMRYHPYLAVIPGLAIILTVLSLNLIGDGLRDALDPKLKN